MNKKTTSRSTAARKKVAPKSRVVAKAKVTAAKRPRKTVVAAKKSAKRKGPIHHAKRLYHLTPKFVHGMIAGAFVGVVLVTSLGITGGVHADTQAAAKADPCVKLVDGVNYNGANANATAKVSGANGCKSHTLIMKTYFAPSSTGAPHEKQVQFAVGDAHALKPGGAEFKFHVDRLPGSGCFYQVDLVDITDGDQGSKNPVIASNTGGNHDCTPAVVKPACSTLGLTPDASDAHKVTITTFTVATGTNISLTSADVYWNYGVNNADMVNVPTALNQSHTYTADGTYIIYVNAHFSYTGQFGDKKTGDANCQATFSPTTPPPGKTYIYVCEITTKRILNIDTLLLGSDTYPNNNYTTDLSQCVVTPPVTPPDTPPTTLANTGPGAVLVVFGMAILGGYAFHMRHRHVQHKKRAHRA